VFDHWLAQVCDQDPWLQYWNADNPVDPPLMRTLIQRLHLDQAIQAQAPFGDMRKLKLENVIFCSESLKQETTCACGLSLDQAVVVPCGIAPDDIRRRPRETPVSGRLAFVARLTEEKDPLTAIRAIQELRHRGYSTYSLDIYGRGKPHYEATLHDYVRRHQLNGAVSFKPLHEEQVRSALHLYDTLLFTSQYPEPFPLVHLKAMAARVPVISTPDGGSAELIRDGENGLLFETGNHYDLADKVEYMSAHPEQVSRMVETAFEEAVYYYTFNRVTSHIESLLHRALDSNNMVVA
jgi:glycogen synthase